MKVFQVTDVDFVAAITADEALKFYNEFCCGATEFKEVRELTDEEMDKQIRSPDFEDDDPMTFRQALEFDIRAGHKFPMIFASTDT